MDNDAIQCIAYAHPASFGIVDDCRTFFRITKLIEISMANACSGFYYRYGRIFTDKIYQPATASRNNKVYKSISMEQGGGCFPGCRKQFCYMGVYIETL